jgi:hypothetical protein
MTTTGLTHEEALATAYRLVELLQRYPSRPLALRWYHGRPHRIPAEQLLPEDDRRLVGVYTADATVNEILEDILWVKTQMSACQPTA